MCMGVCSLVMWYDSPNVFTLSKAVSSFGTDGKIVSHRFQTILTPKSGSNTIKCYLPNDFGRKCLLAEKCAKNENKSFIKLSCSRHGGRFSKPS